MADADTVQKRLSAINYTMPWRGPMVAMRDLDNGYLGETSTHVGTLQSLLKLYGGVMAITYRPGVYVDGSDRSLGTLRSDAVSAGTQIYFVSLDNLLPTDEVANGTPTVTSTNTAITLSSPAVSTAALSNNDGSVVAPIGRAIEFRVTLPTSSFANTSAPILVNWESLTSANKSNCTVTLNIEWNA
jgi:hypothetical protein